LASEERAEFDSLRDGVVSRKSSDSSDGTLRKCGLSSSATSRFYTHSAVRLGLVDSENGIRFQKRPNEIIVTSTPFDVSPNRCEPVGMTALMLAATDPGLREAFEKARAV
jgi:ankyrin repeat protein